MTARVADLKDLPDWPAAMSLEQIACYCGVSQDTFLVLVKKGYYPKAADLPVRRTIWWRADIDAAISRMSGNGPEARMRDWQSPYKYRR